MATVASMWVKVGADIKDLKKNLSEGQKAAQRFADGMGSVGRQLSVAATLPILAMGAASLKTAGDFEASMNRVQAVSGATASEFRALQAQAQQLGATTRYSSSQAADAMGFLAMAGLRVNEILGAMPGTLQLAASANIDLARSADIVTNILTGYGLAVEELGRANDVLVKTFTRTNVDLSMLGESFKYAGPVAKSAGIAFEEAAAAIGLMGNAGIQGSMAGTALRGAITRLLKPTAEVARTLNRLGVSATDSEGRLLSLVEIVRQLEEAGATTGDMMAIFGQRAGPAMAALVDQGADALRSLVRELETAGGTAKRIADVQMRGLNGALAELKSAFEALALAITGTGILDGVTKLTKEMARTVQAIAGLPRPVLLAGVAVAGLVAAIGPLLIIGGKLIALFLQLKLLAAATGVAIGAIAGPVGIAVAAFTALGAAFLAVARHAAKAREATRQVTEEAERARQLRIQTPEGRAEELRRLEQRRDWLLRRVRDTRESIRRAEAAGSRTLARSLQRQVDQWSRELGGVLRQIGELQRVADQAVTTTTAIAAEPAKLLEFTADNIRRLYEEAARLEEEIADIRFELHFAEAADAVAELTARLETLLDRQRRITAETARYEAQLRRSVAAMGEPRFGLQQSVRGMGLRRIEMGMARPSPSAFDRVQQQVREYIERGIPVEALSQIQLEGMRRIIRQREELERKYAEALGMQQRSWLDMLKSGDIVGAAKAAFLPLLKVALPLTLAFEVLKGIMDAIGEPLRALLLPLRMLGEVIGRALLPVFRALWPAIKGVVIAVSYLAQVFFTVSGYLQKGIGWLLEAIGKAVKFLSFGLVKSIEKAGKSLGRMGDESLRTAKEMGQLRSELRDMSFEDALDRVTDAAHRAADALLNVPQGFKVALARFQATVADRTVAAPSPVPVPGAASSSTTVQNDVDVTIHVQAAPGTDVPTLVEAIKREIVRDARRGGATGLELVFGAA